MRTTMNRALRKGFTLVEVLVTLVLIGLLVGVVLPSVIGQLDRGEPTRIVEDMEAVRSGIKLFRVDVKRYPATLEQLSEAPGASGASWDSVGDINAAHIADGLLDRWNGPYLEGSAVTTSAGTLGTALGGSVVGTFITKTLAGTNYLTVQVDGLDTAAIKNISDIVDGDTVYSDNDAGGRVRAGTSSEMFYLVAPVN